MTVAELKRLLPVGKRLTLITANIKQHKMLGLTRAVTKVNSVGLELGDPPFNSELRWPKAADLTMNPEVEGQSLTFNIRHGDIRLTYRIEP